MKGMQEIRIKIMDIKASIEEPIEKIKRPKLVGNIIL